MNSKQIIQKGIKKIAFECENKEPQGGRKGVLLFEIESSIL